MVFISHSTCDRKLVEQLCDYLESQGIQCWVSFRDLTSGSFSGAITRALKACDVFLLVSSKEACRSPHVKNEVSLAFGQNKHIIPFLLDDNPFDDDLEYFLSLKQYIKATGNHNKDFALVEKFIRDYRGEAPVTPVVAPAAAADKGGGKSSPVKWIIPVVAFIVVAGVATFLLLHKSGNTSDSTSAVEQVNKETAAPASPARSAETIQSAEKAQPGEKEQSPAVSQPAEKAASETPAATQQSAPEASSAASESTPAAKETTASSSKASTPAASQSKPASSQSTKSAAASQAASSNMNTFTGTVKGGYPDGFGTYTFKSRRRIDMHDPEERFAEAGDYIKGDWKQGHLNYGEWYSADGTKKGFIRLGDHPDVASDQKLGKCVKR